MTTQYTPTLKLALPVTGELSGTWGDVVNQNITSMVEEAIAGLATISTWTSNAHTLTTANGTTSESRCAMLVASTGSGGTAITAAGTITCPSVAKLYVLKNGTSYAVTLKTAAGTGISVPAGTSMFLFCDGTNVNACETSANLISSTFNGTVGATTPSTGAFTTLSASGRLLTGGATASNWTQTSDIIEGANSLTLMSQLGSLQAVQGAYYNGSSWYYQNSTRAPAMMYAGAGSFGFRVASTGTADTAITWTQPLTISSTGLSVTGALSATGDITNSSTSGRLTFSNAGTSGNGGVQNNDGSAYLLVYPSAHSTEAKNVWLNSTGGSVKIKNGGTDVAVVSSTGLAVTGALSATSTVTVTATNAIYQANGTTGWSGFAVDSTSGHAVFGVDDSAGATFGTEAYAAVIKSTAKPIYFKYGNTTIGKWDNSSLAVTGACYATNWFYANTSTTGFSSGSGAWPLIFGINGTEKARIDTSGNLGLGVTPSAWTFKALEIGYAGNALWSSSTNDVRLSANLNYNSGYKYTNTGAATNYVQSAGAHYWYNAPSGSAGAAATFTQAMTLDASGNLQTYKVISVGNATPSSSGAGITFPATQSASTDANTLDDYEEGTWTPTQGSGLTVVGSFSSSGKYTKVGNLVTVTGYVSGSTSVAATASGNLANGLPFTSVASFVSTGSTVFGTSGGTQAAVNLSSSTIFTQQAIAAINTIYFTCTYFTAT